MAAVGKDKELSKTTGKNVDIDIMSLPRKEIDVTYKGRDLVDSFLVHKIVDHVKYRRLREFAEWLDIKESDYESIIAKESSPSKKVQAVSKTRMNVFFCTSFL